MPNNDILQQLFMIYSYIKLFGAFDSIKLFGYRLPLQIEKERVELAIKLNKRQYKNILQTLQKAELFLKTNPNIDKKSFLFSTLIKIKGLL